jgi:hypothetical protein
MTYFAIKAISGIALQGIVAVVLGLLGLFERVYGSHWYLAGSLLGAFLGIVTALTPQGREALNADFWRRTVKLDADDGDGSALLPSDVFRIRPGAVDQVDEYFRDAVYVFMHPDRPSAARLAALTAGKIAPRVLRASMIDYLRRAASAGRPADPAGARELDALADDIEEKDWDVLDVMSAKRALSNAAKAYASALDTFDQDVFRRLHPHLFSVDTNPADAGTDEDVIEAYARTMQSQKGVFKSESTLPYPKHRIRATLLRASKTLVYRLGDPAVRVALMNLDTFLPDDKLASANALLVEATRRSRLKEFESCAQLLATAPEIERNALLAALGVVQMGGHEDCWELARRAVAALSNNVPKGSS